MSYCQRAFPRKRTSQPPTHLQDHRWRDAMRQQLVQPRPDLHQIRRRLFLYDLIGDLAAVCLPVCFGDVDIGGQVRAVIRVITNVSADACATLENDLWLVAHLCILNASKINNAFRIFPLASAMIDKAVSSGKLSLSFLATCLRTFIICHTDKITVIKRFKSAHERRGTRRSQMRGVYEPLLPLELRP